ncbi:P-loop containing nucleoside triphosphate hydrolase protein [Trichoderma asperelloides]|nr:P-loop containing nucleoside triphosphate hydrolase protein [Trichoderma asperelloides]
MESIARNQATIAQVQRLEDAPLNPLTGNVWPSNHDDILQGRRRLPVYDHYQEILDKYHRSQVVILSSETGSGKSTQIPQLLVYDDRVADEMGVILGDEVGYKVRYDQKFDKKKTRLTYMTEGVLLRTLSHDKNLSAYACVVIDEAHERTTDLDLLLALLKKTVSRRKDFKLVIMSATMETQLFQDYFSNCPLVHIEGSNFGVEVLYTRDIVANFVTAAASIVLKIHKDHKPGNILVFLPGKDEIDQVCRLVREHTGDLDVFPLHSLLSVSDQRLALASSGPSRKCIVSTNIAETSLTIDNVVYVVDSGLSRQLIFNPRLRLNMLELRPISQASAKQRTGRAGRMRDGICYRLYSKEEYDLLATYTEPAIRCAPVHSVILKLVTSGWRKMFDFDWIDAPNPESIARAADDLRDWGFLNDDASFTLSGRIAARCTLDPIWWRAIEVGIKIGCTMNIVDIALLCSSERSIFLRPPGFQQVADLMKAFFADPLSDHLTLANAFDAYMQARQLHQQGNGPKFDLAGWCFDHALNIGALEEVCRARLSFGNFLNDTDKGSKNIKIPRTRAPATDTARVRKALAIAFCTQTAIRRTEDAYRTVHGNASALLSPHSSLVEGNHEWVIYDTFHKTGGKQYLQIVTAIDPEWLVIDLPKKRDGSLRQPNVKLSLDNAKARIETTKN